MSQPSPDSFPSSQVQQQVPGKSSLSAKIWQLTKAHWRWTLVFSCLFAALTVAGVLIHIEPAFYATRLSIQDPEQQAERSKQFLAKATRLLSALQGDKTWSEEFDEELINAWLTDDFELNHAQQVLPEGVSKPRIEIDGDVARIGFRCKKGPIQTVIHVGIKAWVPRRDVLAVEFDRAWSGYFPLPTTYTQHLIESFAHSHSMDVTWKRHNRSLVALLEFPRDHRDLILQKVEIKENSLRLKGVSGRYSYPAPADYAPSAN